MSSEFDPSAPPPFKIADIRASIPKHCWVKSTWRSLSYVLRDLVIVSALMLAAFYFDNWVVWPIYWALQGTMFWAIFVLGHDCGHGSFSDSTRVNNLVGHFLHSAILVPYHGWRISHRTHHQNHGNVENDESWVPMTEKIYNSLDNMTKFVRFTLPLPMLAYPFYLWTRTPGKTGSHYHPYSDLFSPNERKQVTISTLCWVAMFSSLLYLSYLNPLLVTKLYWVPYWIFVMWLDFVTYLHHHGYTQKLPWYRGEEWSYLRGGLTTVDRDYGWINNIHHDIGTHVIHHLFPQIPHYHLVEATKAAKPVIGEYYREPEKSTWPIPFHLLKYLVKSMSQDHFVSDTGNVVFYQTDPNLKKKHYD